MLHTFLTQACRSCVWADWVQFHAVPEIGEQMGDLESYFPPISDPVLSPDQHLCFPSHHPHPLILARLLSLLPSLLGETLPFFNRRLLAKVVIGTVIKNEG